jgi:hypothetical protein
MEAGAEIAEEQLRTWLEAELPKYMYPAVVYRMDDLPRTANRKMAAKVGHSRVPPVTHTLSRPQNYSAATAAAVAAPAASFLSPTRKLSCHGNPKSRHQAL